MVLKVYVASICPSTEVKKRTQRVLFVLDSKKINYVPIDITEPGHEKDKEFIRDHCKVQTGKTGIPQPPQIFSEDDYCGDFDDFERATEDDQLLEFLKLKEASSSVRNEYTNGAAEDPAGASEVSSAIQNGEDDVQLMESHDDNGAEVVADDEETAAATFHKDSVHDDEQEKENDDEDVNEDHGDADENRPDNVEDDASVDDARDGVSPSAEEVPVGAQEDDDVVEEQDEKPRQSVEKEASPANEEAVEKPRQSVEKEASPANEEAIEDAELEIEDEEMEGSQVKKAVSQSDEEA